MRSVGVEYNVGALNAGDHPTLTMLETKTKVSGLLKTIRIMEKLYLVRHDCDSIATVTKRSVPRHSNSSRPVPSCDNT